MTQNKHFKRRVRAYAAEHGLKYTQALCVIREIDEAARVQGRPAMPKTLEIAHDPERGCFDCPVGKSDANETWCDALALYIDNRNDTAPPKACPLRNGGKVVVAGRGDES
jgi:hypothetical protein